MSTRGDLHKKSRSGITPRGSYKRLPFPVPPLPTNRLAAQRFLTGRNKTAVAEPFKDTPATPEKSAR
jgi:hypothetical protein